MNILDFPIKNSALETMLTTIIVCNYPCISWWRTGCNACNGSVQTDSLLRLSITLVWELAG